MSADPPAIPLPDGVRSVYAFGVLNTLSWTVIQGVPLLLFLKSQGASALVVGIGTALVPLLQILQLAGASRAARIGYKRLVLEGWTGRTCVVLAIAAVALAAPWLGPAAVLWLILPLLAVYTALRGLAGAGFAPWWSRLVPAGLRGRFLATESAFMNLALIASLLGCSAFLARWHGPAAYAVLFLWAFATGVGAVVLLRRIPAVAPEPEGSHPVAVPWRALLAHRPFISLVLFYVLLNAAMSGAGVCWVTLLRDRFAASDARITLLPTLSATANLAVLALLVRVLDRVGSKPVMALGAAVMAVHLLLWGALAAGLLPYGWGALVGIQASAGMAAALINVAGTRLLMATVPGQGRAHFFAIQGVAAALVLGLLPAAWGGGIDLMRHLDLRLGGMAVNAWSVLYPLLALLALASLLPLAAVPEPRALRTGELLHELVVRTPARALSRLLGWVG